jgi:VanZ family protein
MNTANKLDIRKANPSEFIIRLFAPAVWAAIILWLSLTPSPPELPGFLGWDKLLHAGAYGLLAVLVAQFILYLTHNLERACWHAGLLAICYGALLEVLQLYLQTGRTAEWRDLFADIVGVCFSCVIFRQICGLVLKPDENPDANNG